MKPFIKSRSSLLLAALLCSASPVLAQDWWSITDADFANQYATKATGSDPVDQSRVAWMLFARLSQPKAYQSIQITQWEDWPSDIDTFHPSKGTSFLKTGKVRPIPHLQISKTGAHRIPTHPNKNITQSGGEEVTRNRVSYDYIMSNKLHTKDGVAAFLGSKKPSRFSSRSARWRSKPHG